MAKGKTRIEKEYDSERFDKFDHFVNSCHEASQKYRQWVKKNAAYKPAALTYGKKEEKYG